MRESGNLIILHSICSAYGKLPSEYMELETPWARWQMDEVTLYAGRKAERDAQSDGADPKYSAVGKGKIVGYKSAAQGRTLKRVKIKANGTW